MQNLYSLADVQFALEACSPSFPAAALWRWILTNVVVAVVQCGHCQNRIQKEGKSWTSSCSTLGGVERFLLGLNMIFFFKEGGEYCMTTPYLSCRDHLSRQFVWIEKWRNKILFTPNFSLRFFFQLKFFLLLL